MRDCTASNCVVHGGNLAAKLICKLGGDDDIRRRIGFKFEGLDE